MGKGSRRRPEDSARVRRNWDDIEWSCPNCNGRSGKIEWTGNLGFVVDCRVCYKDGNPSVESQETPSE